jgi:hypothetical protein
LPAKKPIAKAGAAAWCQFVGPVIISLFKYFLVKTCPVETGFFSQYDIVLQIFIARSCPDTFRIESLIEYQTLEVRLVVQIETSVGCVHFAHTGV